MKQSRGSLAQKASLNGNVECLWYMLCALWRTTEICWEQLILAAVVDWDCHKSVVPWAHFPGIFRFEHYMKYSTYTMLYIFTFLVLENTTTVLLDRTCVTLLHSFCFFLKKTNITWNWCYPMKKGSKYRFLQSL